MADFDNKGRFAKGNKAHGGAPHSKRIAEIKELLYASTDNTEVLAIWAMVVATAQNPKNKDWMKAVGMVFERLLGPPPNSDIEERIDKLQELVDRYEQRMNPQQKDVA